MLPKRLHFIWYNPPVPERWSFVFEAWRKALPDWEIFLWTKDNLPPIQNPEVLAGSRNCGEWSDIVRYNVMLLGGLYADVDLYPVDGLNGSFFQNIKTLVCSDLEFTPGKDLNRIDTFHLSNPLIGGQENDPFWQHVLDRLPWWIRTPDEDWRTIVQTLPPSEYCVWKTGPRFLTRRVREYQDYAWSQPVTEDGILERAGITLLPKSVCLWRNRKDWFEGKQEVPPGTSFIHLYGGSWTSAENVLPANGNYI